MFDASFKVLNVRRKYYYPPLVNSGINKIYGFNYSVLAIPNVILIIPLINIESATKGIATE